MRLRDAMRIVHVNRHVRVRTAQVHGHRGGFLLFRDSLHAVLDFFLTAVEFELELLDEGLGVVAVELIEGLARNQGDCDGDQSDRRKESEYEINEKFRAKRHEMPSELRLCCGAAASF